MDQSSGFHPQFPSISRLHGNGDTLYSWWIARCQTCQRVGCRCYFSCAMECQQGNHKQSKREATMEDSPTAWDGAQTVVSSPASSPGLTRSIRIKSDYWVKGMKLRCIQDYTAEKPDELTVSLGDVMVFLGSKENSRCLCECRGMQGWLPLHCCELMPYFSAKVDPQKKKAHRGTSAPKVKIGNIKCTSPLTTVGMYRSNSEQDLRVLVVGNRSNPILTFTAGIQGDTSQDQCLQTFHGGALQEVGQLFEWAV